MIRQQVKETTKEALRHSKQNETMEDIVKADHRAQNNNFKKQ